MVNGVQSCELDLTVPVFYRGMSDSKYKLVSSLYRSDNLKTEKYFFNEIQVRCPEAFKSFDNLEKLVYMQHYGCPTRLLDITSNPLVALYFSCLGNPEEDGIVYVFNVASNDVLYAKSDRLQMLTKFAEFSKNDQDILRAEAYIYVMKDRAPLMKDSTYGASVLERFYHAIKRDNGGFERQIYTLDLLVPKVVQPNRNNNRMIKQDGAFIISGLDFDENDSDKKIKYLVQNDFIIDRKHKKEILDELEKIGIHQASLFPEIDQVASYLKSSNNGYHHKSYSWNN